MTPSASSEREFLNVYGDPVRAAAYAELEFPATYYLAFRDLPAIIAGEVGGRSALDFGCGAGRSTRFLRSLGFDVVGVDIAEPMVAAARKRDPQGDYRLVPEGDLSALANLRFDLVLSAFAFDNIPTMAAKVGVLRSLRRLLSDRGRIVNLVSAPEIYLHEWTSFSTRDFPGNRVAQSGEVVRIVMLDVPDRRPVEDILWTDADYRESYHRAGLRIVRTHHPLGRPDEPYPWASETVISPWTIYGLAPRSPGADATSAPPGCDQGHGSPSSRDPS